MARVIARQMRERGHGVHLCMSTREMMVQRTSYDGVPVTALPSFEPRDVQHILDWRPDIIHAIDAVDPSFPRAALGLAQAWQLPLVVTPASAVETWQDFDDTMTVCRRADIVFVLTKWEAEYFQGQGVAAERLMITGQGPYLTEAADPGAFRHRHGFRGPLVLFLGRKVFFKGYHLLLEAGKYVWEQSPETTFLFIGPRWDSDCLELFQRYADLRIVEMELADEHEKHSALRACDILCLPTMTDVFPLVFVEAWACGKPVISTPFAGVADVVRDGVDGLVVAHDANILAQAIVMLLKNPARCQAMGRAGRERVLHELNWDVVADRIEAGYHRCDPVGARD